MLGKQNVDHVLTLPGFDQTPPPDTGGFPDGFAKVPDRVYSIPESAGSRTSRHTFRWLPWVPGKVSCVTLAGSDILTGPMSGCWLVVFELGGMRYAGHIGTDSAPSTAASLAAKAAWRNAVKSKTITPVAAFNPTGSLPAPGSLNLKNEAAEFYGAFEPGGTGYLVVLTVQGKSGNARRIAKVDRIATKPDVSGF